MSQNIKIKLVVATRKSIEIFWANSATGKSLSLFLGPHLEVVVYPHNAQGLPEIYNKEIEKSKGEPCILVFAHDDLYFLDFFWMQ